MMKRLYLFCLFVFMSAKIVGQTTTCPQTLRLAHATYDQGRLHEVPSLLESCLESDELSPQQKAEGYRLVVLSYIYLEEPKSADDNMLMLLRTDPYFVPSQTDPAEFIALYKTFRTRPIYRIGAGVGVQAAQPNVVEYTPAVPLADGSKYKFLIGLQVGAIADLPVTDNITGNAKLLFSQKRFSIDLIVDRSDPNIGTLKNTFSGIESQSWISLPLMLQYRILEKKYNPYVALGASVDYLLNAELTAERTREGESSITESTFDFKPQREKINLSVLGAIGGKMRVGGGFAFAELQFVYGLAAINSKETAFNNQQLALDEGYSDPVFKMVSAGITLGYVQNIFNPKKKTQRKK